MTGEPAEFIDASDEEEAIEELVEELESVEATVESGRHRRTILRTQALLRRLAHRPRFGFDDLAQQIVGAFILSAPFVVTEEVWSLATSMSWVQTSITVLMVLSIGYGTLYRAEDRDVRSELTLLGVPLRYLSLIVISYGAVVTLAMVLDAPDTFDASPVVTFKAICIGAIFSVVGAATADSIF